MKTILLIAPILLFTVTIGYAQILLESKLDGNLKVFQLSDGTVKFYKVDSHEKKLFIFNADNSIWRSIDLPVVKYHLIDDVRFISGTSPENEIYLNILFTCYYQKTYPTEDVPDFFSIQGFMLNVIDEKGEVILKIPEALEYKILSVAGDNKLLVYKIVRKGLKSKSQLDVYGFNNN